MAQDDARYDAIQAVADTLANRRTSYIVVLKTGLRRDGHDEEPVYFQIRRCSLLRRLMQTYCDRERVAMGSLRFVYNGNTIVETQTPDDLGMIQDDEVVVMPLE